ncbi:Uncharacterised protein [Candidatus Gugararchaeum adminiculabundum]|nr:Uncharacterised protein [Candidatus Gugararchaeum adminiculabundum]
MEAFVNQVNIPNEKIGQQKKKPIPLPAAQEKAKATVQAKSTAPKKPLNVNNERRKSKYNYYIAKYAPLAILIILLILAAAAAVIFKLIKV